MAIPKNYYNFFDICKMEKINPNTAKSAVGGNSLAGIASISKLKPIAHLFREFPKGMRKQYGILRRYYDYWKRTGDVPKVSPGRPKKWQGDEKNINIPAPPFYEQFKAGIEKANSMSTHHVTVREVIYVAMKEYMARRPALFGADINGSNQGQEGTVQ